MNSTKTKIKVGDRVKIINPEFFVRCGYDNNLKSQAELIESNHKRDILDLIGKVFPRKAVWNPSGSLPDEYYHEGFRTNLDIAVNKIASALAYEAVKRDMRSGAERKVFTKRRDLTIGWDCYNLEVEKVKFVKTGKYVPSSSGYEDWEPGYLSGEKTHRILQLETGDWIEDIHVEKVE